MSNSQTAAASDEADVPETGGKSDFIPRNRRRILCVTPPLSHSLATMDNSFPLLGVRGFSPVQGMLVIAGYLPKTWEVRYLDESVGPVSDAEIVWADVIFMTGMHIQREHIDALNERAHALGRITVLGGPSVSGAPTWYPDVDIVHIGELGDATDRILARLDESVARPKAQERYDTKERVPMAAFPTPAYHLISLDNYLMGTVQFSSGCPYRCEFCDIPELYGRNPRLKTPEQVTRELDAMLERGNPGAVYIVDDNFIGNRKAAVELLKELVKWQEARGFPIIFGCEATLNLAQMDDVLELMREAAFQIVFCGVETPDIAALKHMHKEQNLRIPILDAIKKLNDFGMNVVSGIIIGLDTDTAETGPAIREFIKASHVPFLTINVLQALPRTPLWRRLEAAGRLLDDPDRESNVRFIQPEEEVMKTWRDCVADSYEPGALFDRFDYQFEHVFPHRKKLPNSPARTSTKNMLKAARIIPNLLWHLGIRASYRRRFWKTALPALRRGQIEELIFSAMTAYHLIQFAKEAEAGKIRAGLYDPRTESAKEKLAVLRS